MTSEIFIVIFILISVLVNFLIKVGEDDYWLGTGTESWGEVMSSFLDQHHQILLMMLAMMKWS